MCGFCGEAYLSAVETESGANSGDIDSQDSVASTVTVIASGNDWDGILHSNRWGVANLTYSFPTDASAYPNFYGNNQPDTFSPLSSAQQTAVFSVFAEVESFTALTFTQVANNSSASVMRFGETTTNTPTAAGYYPNNFFEEGGDTWYRDGNYETPTLGSYAYNEGFTHEIGHALGLEHGHEIGSFGIVSSIYDTNEYTVMTYRDHYGDGIDFSENEIWGNAQSFMMFDIAALQYMYGPDFSAIGNTWSGNSTYTFSSTTGEVFINGVGQGTPGGNRIFRTIWDGHGEDTYDLSNYSTEMLIDLRPGEWSIFDVNQLADLDGGSRGTNLARGNVANALLFEGNLGSLIENAIGGTSDDTIFGNEGANRLEGRRGDDTLIGGLGNDHLLGGDNDDVLFGDDINVASGSGVLVSAIGSGNDSIATATSLDNLFHTEFDPNVEYSSSLPHVTVSGTGEGNTKFFSFTILAAGTNIILDIDNTSVVLDTLIRLYDPNGNVVSSNDDSSVSQGRYGSTTTLDSYIDYDALIAGTYSVEVTNLGNSLTNSDTFDLHVIIGGPVVGLTTPTAGHDLLDGGTGTDTVIFNSNRADVHVKAFDEGIVTSSTNDGHDRILNIENLQFHDQLISTSTFNSTASIFEYCASYSDLIALYGTDSAGLLEHYALSGMAENRSISFSGLEYIASHGDLISVLGIDRAAGAQHFIEFAAIEGRRVTFNSLEYIASYGDLIGTYGANAQGGVLHYLSTGFNEGRQVTFDSLAYIASYGDLIDAFGADAEAGVAHYLSTGFNEGRQVTFDSLAYIASYGDLIDAFGADAESGVAHYLSAGFNEGRQIIFDGLEYIASYGDLIDAFGANSDAGVAHYLSAGFNESRQITFDGLEYIASYGDLIDAFGANADAGITHYLNAGFNEGREANFDSRFYLGNYGDLRDAFGTDTTTAAAHFIQNGFLEGRTAEFNSLEYIASYGDLITIIGANASAGRAHFLSNGFLEGRGDLFDAKMYLNAAGNEDVLAAYGADFVGATIHYIEYGFYEGRSMV